MSKLVIIGDSNVYRHIRPSVLAQKIGMQVTLLQCTRESSFASALDLLQREKAKVVLFSVLSNFVSDSCSDNFAATYDDLLERFLSLIPSVSDSHILVVPPVLRYKPEWYRDHYPAMILGLKEKLQTYPNLLMTPEFRVTEPDLEADQVHFTKTTGVRFLEFLTSTILDLPSEVTIISEAASPTPKTAPAPLQSTATPDDIMRVLQEQVLPNIQSGVRADQNVDKLSKFVLERTSHDDLMFARIREELDFKNNLGKANRVLFVNVSGSSIPDQLSAYKTQLTGIVKPLVDKVVGKCIFDVLPRRGGLKNGFYPPFELKFQSPKVATQFRRGAVKGLRDAEPFTKTVLAPSVTIATRVRFEVLKAISMKLTDPQQRGYCPMFSLRPLLHVGPLINDRVVPRTTLTYVDAIERYGDLIQESDLEIAYQRAGLLFKGVMRQNFVVLRDPDTGKRKRGPDSSPGEPEKKREKSYSAAVGKKN